MCILIFNPYLSLPYRALMTSFSTEIFSLRKLKVSCSTKIKNLELLMKKTFFDDILLKLSFFKKLALRSSNKKMRVQGVHSIYRAYVAKLFKFCFYNMKMKQSLNF